MNLIKKLSVIFDRTLGLLAALGAVVIAFMTVIVCWDVICRYFIGSGPIWVLEVTEYGLLWFTLLASAWVLKGERHVKIDILLLRLYPKTRALVNIITSVFATVACLIVVWYSTGVVWEYMQSGERLPSEIRPYKFIPYLILPIGFLLLFMQFFRRTYGYFLTWKTEAKKK
ncbi:MAG: TRAP transporter small permease [Deltaproteobacteria bacterium]|nr:TRAP transporter small permease [Deltaproteobacteria bacterium]